MYKRQVYYLINDIVIRDAKLHEKERLELQVKNQIQMYRSVSENFDIQKNSLSIHRYCIVINQSASNPVSYPHLRVGILGERLP